MSDVPTSDPTDQATIHQKLEAQLKLSKQSVVTYLDACRLRMAGELNQVFAVLTDVLDAQSEELLLFRELEQCVRLGIGTNELIQDLFDRLSSLRQERSVRLQKLQNELAERTKQKG